jgi:putative copper export protein
MSDQQALVVGGTAKFGKLLVQEAEKANQERIQKLVVNNLSGVLTQIQTGKDMITKFEASVASLEARVAALKAGHFDISKAGMIVYHKAELNEAISWISECQQCGYQKVVIAKV